MFLIVFDGPKCKGGELKTTKFPFLISAELGIAAFSLQNVPESVGVSGGFPY